MALDVMESFWLTEKARLQRSTFSMWNVCVLLGQGRISESVIVTSGMCWW